MFGINFNKTKREQLDVYESNNKGIAEIFNDHMGERVNAKLEECMKLPEVIEPLAILDGLKQKYGKELEFHNREHTLDVMHEVILFVLSDEKLNDKEKEKIIKTQVIAAAWHDVGFIEQMTDNEKIAKEMFLNSKSINSINADDINEICANIMNTKIYYDEKKNYLEQLKKVESRYDYLTDADLSNFGRPDFMEMNERVALELGIMPWDIEKRLKFYKTTIDFMEHHEYKTDSARILRNTQKMENLEKLKSIYHDLLAKNV